MNEVTAPYYNVQNDRLRNEALRDALLLGAGGTAAAGGVGAYLGSKARSKTVKTIEEILKAIPSNRKWAVGGAAALGVPIGLGTASAALLNRLGYDDEKSPSRGAATGAVVGGASGAFAGDMVRKALIKKLPSLSISKMYTVPPVAIAGALFGGLSGAGAGYLQRMKARKQLREMLNQVEDQTAQRKTAADETPNFEFYAQLDAPLANHVTVPGDPTIAGVPHSRPQSYWSSTKGRSARDAMGDIMKSVRAGRVHPYLRGEPIDVLMNKKLKRLLLTFHNESPRFKGGPSAHNRLMGLLAHVELPHKLHELDAKTLAADLRRRILEFSPAAYGTHFHATGLDPKLLDRIESTLEFAKAKSRPIHLKAWHAAKAHPASAAAILGGTTALSLALLGKKREKTSSSIAAVSRADARKQLREMLSGVGRPEEKE